MTIGERIEASPVGQALIALAAVVVAVSVLVWNLPGGPVAAALDNVTDPVVQSLGLEQDWALFAPNPRDISVGVYADVTLRDGRVEHWVPPHNGVFVTPYRTYRWQKYVERLRADDYADLWKPTALWLVRRYGGAAKVRRVDLVRTFSAVVTPGSGRPQPWTRSYLFYEYTP